MAPEPSALSERPWEVVAVLVWTGSYWVVGTSWSFVYSGSVTGQNVAYALLWTAILALWMWRIWQGGSMAVHYMARLLMAFAVFAPGGVALAILTAVTGSELRKSFEDWPTLQLVLLTIPMIVFGAVSFVMSRLLRRPAVTEWTRSRAAG